MSATETLINLFATVLAYAITIGILLLPLYITVKVIKAIARKIRTKKRREKLHVYNTFSDEWKSEWTWNEKTQLWEHPLSKKNETEGVPYRYASPELHKENEPAKIDVTIPENIQELIRKAKIEKARKEAVKPEKHQQKPREQSKPNVKISEYANAYEATPILTKNEFQNFKTLNEAATRKGYMVWSKVRLADIVTPRRDSKYMSHFGKIKSKHVDFVIVDQNARVKAVIELDDKSHDREDRKQRDEFVDAILHDCGIKIIHTRYINHDILDSI